MPDTFHPVKNNEILTIISHNWNIARKLLAGKYYEAMVSKDLKRIYYLDENEELIRKTKNKLKIWKI